MIEKIKPDIINFALNKCCKVVNPYIFEDMQNQKSIYIGFNVKKKPKKGKTFSFYGVDIFNVHLKNIEEIFIDVPLNDVIELKNSQPIYYITTDSISAVVYIMTKDFASHKFDDECIMELYINLSKNPSFNYEYLSKKKMLAAVYVHDIYSLIGTCITYNPIRNDTFDTSLSIKTPPIKKLIPIPYSNNMFMASFRKCVIGDKFNGIVLINGYNMHTRDALLYHNGHYCMLCGTYHKDIQWHHLLPRSLKGSDNYYNASLLCPTCHKLIHDCQKNSPEIFDELTRIIIKNRHRIGAIYPSIKDKDVEKITF